MPRERLVSPEKILKLLCNVNIQSALAVYSQIENSVRFAVAAGDLVAGDKLPSVRELSEVLEVNPNTIAKAYRDLEVMGIVTTRRGMGVFIKDDAVGRCRKEVFASVSGRIFEIASEAKAAGLSMDRLLEVMRESYKAANGAYCEAPKAIKALANKLAQ